MAPISGSSTMVLMVKMRYVLLIQISGDEDVAVLLHVDLVLQVAQTS